MQNPTCGVLISNKLINGPISKEHFLNKKFLGITEYLAHKTNAKNYAMLIYNKKTIKQN